MKSFDLETVKRFVAKNNVTNNQAESLVVDQFAKSIIDKVFKELSVIFPAWKNAWPTEKELDMAKLQWTKAFVENNISTIDQIQFGFKKARQADSDFLPSCGKFISWCCPSPEDLGYPDEQQALRLCVAYRSNTKLGIQMNVRPLIIELTKRLDWWLIETAGSQAEHRRAEKHFKECYLDLIRNYVEPKEIDAPRLPTRKDVINNLSSEQKAATKERGLDHINSIKEKLKKSKLNKPEKGE